MQTLVNYENNAIIDKAVSEGVWVSRQELENERRSLLSRLQQIQRLLGLEPIQTGKQERLRRIA